MCYTGLCPYEGLKGNCEMQRWMKSWMNSIPPDALCDESHRINCEDCPEEEEEVKSDA